MKVLLLILAFAVSFSAQTVTEKIAKVEKPKDIESSYDKFKDITTVYIKGIVFETKGNRWGMYSIGLQAAFVVPGEKVTKDVDSFKLMFYSTGSQWHWLRDSRLIILADGEHMDFGQGERDSRINNSTVSEFVFFTLTRTQFEKLVNAKSVELQIGTFEGNITNRSRLAQPKA